MAHLELSFDEDSQRRVRAEGRISATLVFQCQRCAQGYDQLVDTAIAGVVVRDDEAAASVPREDEPIMAEGDTLSVVALAEDELLLALPWWRVAADRSAGRITKQTSRRVHPSHRRVKTTRLPC